MHHHHDESTTSTPDILHFPLEIAMEIFTLTVPRREFFMAYHGHQSTRNKTSLPHERSHCASQVCRRWRAIALSTPHMWTDIPIFRMLNSPWKGEDGWDVSIIDELDRYLARSGALPIHIFIDLYDCAGFSPIPDDVLRGILSSFFREAYRWQTAVLLIDAAIISQIPIPNLSSLKKLNFTLRGLTEDSLPFEHLATLETGDALPFDYLAPILEALPPALEVLVLDGKLYPIYASSATVIKPTIETFIGLPPSLEALEQQAYTLKKCIFRGMHLCDMDLPPDDKKIIFPGLKSLELNEIHRFKPCVHFEDGPAFGETTPFHHIDAPNLDELIVRCGRVPHDCAHILVEIQQAAVASSWKLTSLVMSLNLMPWFAFAEVLGVLPTLQLLDVFEAPINLMVESLKQAGFLPKLEKLLLRLFFLIDSKPTMFAMLETVQLRPGMPSLGIETVFASPRACCGAYEVFYGLWPIDRYRRRTGQLKKLIGWRRFLTRQLLICDSNLNIRLYGLTGMKEKRGKLPPFRNLDVKNVEIVLTLLEQLDILSGDDVMESRLIEVLEAFATLPFGSIPKEDIFDIKCKAAEISQRLVEQIRKDGYTWPPNWFLGEEGRSLCLQENMLLS